MNKNLEKLLRELKTREEVKALGFNKEEIKSFASDLVKNLSVEEDASDEDVESAINTLIDDAIPYLRLTQRVSSRIVKKAIEKKPKVEEYDGEEDVSEEDGEDEVVERKPAKRLRQKKTAEDELKASLKEILKKLEKQDETIAALRQGNVTDKRRERLNRLIKDTGTFGRRVLREFDKLAFKDEDDFEEYLEGVKEDLEEANQERANVGLAKLGAIPQQERQEKKEDVEQLSDREIEELARLL